MNFWSTLIILCCCFVGWFSIGVYGGDIVHEDDKAPKKPGCENNFVLVKVPTWVDGFEDNEYVGIGARFGPTLESKEKHANQTRLSLADPPDCCSPPKNKLTGEAILVYRGNCSFTTKTNIAEDAGASAILIVNNSTDLFKMVCEDDADTNIRIPAVMLPVYAGETLEDLLYNNSKVYVQLYSPKRPEVDVAEVFLWLMAVGTILCASYWAAWNAMEAAIEQEKMLKDASEEMLISADSGSTGFVDISTRSALLFIVVASCFLVMLYKLMSLWFIDVLVVLFCIGGAEKEMGEKLLSAVDLLQKFKNYHDELQVEKDHALQEAKELRKQLTRELSRSYVPISDFSLSDIEKATNYFDPALKIGKGGKGSTYKGFLHHTNVAIKLLNPNNILGPREFEQEVNVLNKLRHPNIVTLMGVCSESWSLVYEYLPRGSLEDWLFCKDNTPSLTWKTRIQIATQLCSVLIFLHSSCSNSIIKGYLTPANILLDDNFVCKLLDFGTCAGIPNEGISMDQTRFIAIELKDTFMYKAPEFLVNGEFTPKSDVFSFGIILLHLLTGTQALGAKEVESALAKDDLKVILDHSAGDWPFVQAKQLAHMALRCCDMNPINRPDLVSDIWRVLEPMKASFQPLSRLLLDSEDQVPHYFICPIFQEIMEDPHIAADGFTYEAEAIKGWLDSCHDTSPMTNEKLANHDLIPNRALRSAIQEWLQHRCSV